MRITKRAGLVISALLLGAGTFTSTSAIATPAPVSAGAAADSACPYDLAHPSLWLGDTGKAVTHAQCLLNIYGMGVAEDGIFGSGTQRAVKAIQARCGITADGIVGPNTWNCLHPDKTPNP
ncbi:peptidoglycan-binding protein [Streptomyces sp. NPDC059781]|uniref:peptidoglycan-binding domain-containing protein n=1 Tax=Streptomyces sp. NPDC059781 TaxID=3346943 RepID=UPI003656ACAE